MGVLVPYIARFGLESSRIGTRTLSKMITFIPFHDISAFCPKAKEGFHPFYENFFPNSDAGVPFVLTLFWTISQVFLYPSPVARPEMIVGLGSDQPLQPFIIDQDVLSAGLLDLVVPAERPHGWMTDHTRAHHVGIDINHTTCQMIAVFHCRRMITVFPVRTLVLCQMYPGMKCRFALAISF